MSGIIGVSPDMRSGGLGKFPSGTIIQMKQTIRTSSFSVASSQTSYVTANLAIVIIPRFKNSTFFIEWSAFTYRNSSNSYAAGTQLRRDASAIETKDYWSNEQTSFNGASNRRGTFAYLDTPNTLSSITYDIYCNSPNSGTTSQGSQTYLIVKEIAI